MNDFITGEELRRQSSMGWVKAYLWATVVHGIQPVEHLKTCAAAAYTFLVDGGTLDDAKEDLSQWAKAYPLDKPVSERVLFPKKGAQHAHA